MLVRIFNIWVTLGVTSALQMPMSSSPTVSVSSSNSKFGFSHPLLTEGYPPAVIEYELNQHLDKPMLLYLPGFDGTLVAPFLQFPELGTEFDVRGLSIDMSDRSTFCELRDGVINYILSSLDQSKSRPIFVLGESFGGILASEVCLTLQERHPNVNIGGLVLINPATCYTRSRLYVEAPPVSQITMSFAYITGLAKLLPLFADSYQMPQLLMMLSSEALPSIIDTPAREAYMGRVAFSLADKLKFMPRETLDWRLTRWLEDGCDVVTTERLKDLSKQRVLIVVGEVDEALPSTDEAKRLQNIISNSEVHVVDGAGHSATCGSRVDLTALMRRRFSELDGRKEMKKVAADGVGKYFGMEPREIKEGLSPLRYWGADLYRKLR